MRALLVQQRCSRSKPHSKSRPMTERALDFHFALMRANYLIADSKAETGSAVASRARMIYAIEPAKYPGLFFDGNAYSCVNDVHANEFAVVFNADTDAPIFWGVLQSVFDQVAQCLIYARAVSIDHAIRFGIERKFDTASFGHGHKLFINPSRRF